MLEIPVFTFLFVGGRIAGMVFTVPIFGSRNYPAMLKAGFILFLSILVTPYADAPQNFAPTSGISFFMIMFNEILIGLFLGLLVSLFINFVYYAGDIMDHQMGFSIISVVNPTDETQIPMTANILYILSILVFLVLNLHHKLILGVIYSFQTIEIGTFFSASQSLSIVLEIIRDSFLTGLAIAAPFMITILVSDIILGMLSKAMPGMNIFILGMPFKVFFGLLLFTIVMPFLFDTFGGILDNVFEYWKTYMDSYL